MHRASSTLVGLVVLASVAACERTATRPPEARVDAPEVDRDRDGGDGVQGDSENPDARLDENAGTVEDGS